MKSCKLWLQIGSALNMKENVEVYQVACYHAPICAPKM